MSERRGYLWLTVTFIVASAFNYGFHISALNALSDVITCNYRSGAATALDAPFGLPECVAMSDAQFGILTASYTVGGFLGSMFAGSVADRRGRRAAIVYAAWCIIIGDVIMAAGFILILLVLGRAIIGLGAGASTVIVPLFLSEIAPANIRGSIGVINQVSITVGLFVAVALGVPLAYPSWWRLVPVVSGVLAFLQLLVAPVMPESPVWLANARAGDERKPSPEPTSAADEANATAADDDGADVGSPLLAKNQPRRPMAMGELFACREPGLRRGLVIVVVSMLAQQFSGINAVFYFSTRILGSVLPDQAAYISLFLAFANFVLGLGPLFLIERVGRRPLLLCSLLGTSISSLVLGLAINSSAGILASLFIFCHVASFANGAGPIPFVIISEVVPSYAAGSAGSLGLAVCWFANFVVGLAFLPLQNALAHGSRAGQGNVFFVFAAVTLALLLVLARAYRA